MGRFSQYELDRIIVDSAGITDIGERIAFLSGQLLGIDYAEETLVGDRNTPEIFVINIEEVDCFTFIEYVEAMRLSGSYSGFLMNLKRVRYRAGTVDFMNRNHFFTDWLEFNRDFVDDLTPEIGDRKIIMVQKTLNEKADGTHFLPGIRPVQREIRYLPSEMIDTPSLVNLRTGDYIGIYSDLQGLDVSHVGILIKTGEVIFFRHASSHKQYRKVVDQDFKDYIKNKPGIVVLRPK